jgi:hypothetical protein
MSTIPSVTQERYATCPGCGQEIDVFANRTYFAHGIRQPDGNVTWCGMSYQPIPPDWPVVIIEVSGGVAEVVENSGNVIVEIIDRDVQEVGDEPDV